MPRGQTRPTAADTPNVEVVPWDGKARGLAKKAAEERPLMLKTCRGTSRLSWEEAAALYKRLGTLLDENRKPAESPVDAPAESAQDTATGQDGTATSTD